MNIKFEKLMNRTFEQIKKRWSSILVNSLIVYAITFAVVFVIVFIIMMVGALALALMESGSMYIVGIILMVLTVISALVACMPLAFWSCISGFVVADASMDDSQKFSNSFKKVWTKDNFWFAFKSVILPSLILLIGIYVFLFFALVYESIMSIAFLSLSILPIMFLIIYISSYFLMALYTDTNTVIGREKLSRFTRKQIFYAYLVLVGISIIFGFATSFISLVPVIGAVVGTLFSSVISAGVTQAMILEIKEQVDGVSDNSTQSQVPIFTTNSVQIKSDKLVVTIKNDGAEITSVLKGEEEIMWQADPAYWGRTSPVLFPFVGRLKDDQFSAGGHIIQMQQHGFLRDRRFNLTSQTENSATFEYTSTLADYEIYPCDFTVQITYRVFGSRVTTEYNVINNSNYPMPYQIGAHPAFNVESVNDLELQFPAQQVTKHFFENGLQSKTETAELSNINLSYNLIEENLPCFSNFQSKKLTVKKNGTDFLRFDFESMEYLAVWSPEYKNAKFICIEPWNGICGRVDQEDYLLENKDGMNVLGANSSKVCSYSFEIC